MQFLIKPQNCVCVTVKDPSIILNLILSNIQMPLPKSTYTEMYYIKKKKKKKKSIATLMYSCSGLNYQTVCVYVCKQLFLLKSFNMWFYEDYETYCWILVELLVFINFIKKQKNPQTFDLKCFKDFFSEVNIFHYRTQKWNLQIYKLKTLLVLSVNFGFQQTDVITSFIHFIENHFSFPCSFEPTVQLQPRCEQRRVPPTVSAEIILKVSTKVATSHSAS